MAGLAFMGIWLLSPLNLFGLDQQDEVGHQFQRNVIGGASHVLCVEVEKASPSPRVSVVKSKQKMDYPGVFGAPIKQSFYVWVKVDCLPKELKGGNWQNLLELDSFYYHGYRGLGSHGKYGAEVKSLFTAGAFTAINKGVYETVKSEDSITDGNWLLIYGYLDLYPNNVDDAVRLYDDLPVRPVQVPYKDGDPDLQLFYHWKLAEFGKKKGCACWWRNLFGREVSAEVLKIQKVEKTISVMHP